jgi:restriction system protein
MNENKRTIVDAIKEVMKAKGKPMTVTEVYDAIIDADLYNFNADNPVHIVRSQIRRHCKGLDYPSASPTKRFMMLKDGTYYLLPRTIEQKVNDHSKSIPAVKNDLLSNLRRLHEKYLEDFRRRTLERIKQLEPSAFEVFGKRLLEAYGFQNVVVTRPSKDGGIDGYGILKVGLADLKVAFQCANSGDCER